MKHLNFWWSTGLTAMVVLVMGCAAKTPNPLTKDERIVSPETAASKLDNAHTATPSNPAMTGREKAPGIVVHIDPTTGEVLPEPSPGDAPRTLPQEAAKVPAPQLYEVPSPVPGGGVMIDLQKQFRTPLVATMDEDGKVILKHQSTLPGEIEKK